MPEEAPPFGLLNGQPIGPELPPPVPCEGCGADVWCSEQATAYRENGQPVVMRGVWVRDRLLELTLARPWALSPHVCTVGPPVSRVTVADPAADDEDLDEDADGDAELP
jgi:hypothetical protein